jgi:hypothetical protein
MANRTSWSALPAAEVRRRILDAVTASRGQVAPAARALKRSVRQIYRDITALHLGPDIDRIRSEAGMLAHAAPRTRPSRSP